MAAWPKRSPESLRTDTASAVTAAEPVIARQQDPMVRILITVILLIVALTLVTVAYALITGVFGTGAPRTMAEQKVLAAGAKVDAGSTEPTEWIAYIMALVDDGQYDEAQRWIDKGEITLEDQAITGDMLLMQAYLYEAQGKYDEALETADEAIKTIKDSYETGKRDADLTGNPNKASAWGLHANYWELLLLKAEVYELQEDWNAALPLYDEYLAQNTTAATIFAKRGVAKEELGDTAGAEADFRQTLAFIPDDPTALAGLERIGADR